MGILRRFARAALCVNVLFILVQSDDEHASCGRRLRKSRRGTITSPNYPHLYPNRSECFWYIQAETDRRIVISVKSLDTEEGADYLEIRDGGWSGAKLVGRYSGKREGPIEVELTTNRAWLRFRSDDMVNGGGFELSHAAIQIRCPTFTKSSNVIFNETRRTIGARVSFACPRGYRLEGPPEIVCQQPGSWTPDNVPTCQDVNECDVNDKNGTAARPCHPKAKCENTIGSYECKCKDGFKGNGSECSRVTGDIAATLILSNRDGGTTSASEPATGSWNGWSAWSSCNGSCDTGTQFRQRKCKPRRATCMGSGRQSRSCTSKPCSRVLYTEWSDWSACNPPCGSGGVRTRTRESLVGAAVSKAKTKQIEACNETICPAFRGITLEHARLPGQRARFCCRAERDLPRFAFQWLKNGRPIPGETRNEIEIRGIAYNDAGMYQCNVTSGHFSRLSDAAKLTVYRSSSDSCANALEPEIVELPVGCRTLDGGERRIDVGRCRKSACALTGIGAGLRAYYAKCGLSSSCCREADHRYVAVTCDGDRTRMRMRKVTACTCSARCEYERTTITGRVLDAVDKRPIAHVRVIANGESLRKKTSTSGYYTVTMDASVRRIVVELKDAHGRRYADAIVVVPFSVGGTTYHDIYMRRRGAPKTIDVSKTIQISLDSARARRPGAILEIRKRSLRPVVASNGLAVDHVRAEIQYVDPRNESDMRGAWGEFATVNRRGETIPLDTFGMLKVHAHALNGMRVDVGYARFFVNIKEFGVPTSADGMPRAKLYTLDSRGAWMEAGDLERVGQFAVGRLTSLHKIWNIAAPTSDLCRVKVRSYDYTGQQIGGVVISMLGHNERGKFYTIQRAITDRNGGACLLTKCHVGGSLLAELNGREEPVPPPRGTGTTTPNQTIRFKASTIRSPVYSSEGECESATNDESHYGFASSGALRAYTTNNMQFKADSWYVNPETGRNYCFIRVRVSLEGGNAAVVRATSFARSNANVLYGWRSNVVAMERNQTTTSRIACLEYRCDYLTMTRVQLVANRESGNGNESPGRCRMGRHAAPLRGHLVESVATDELNFVSPTSAWGPSHGLYEDSDKEIALSQCCRGDVNPDGTCATQEGTPGGTSAFSAVEFVCD